MAGKRPRNLTPTCCDVLTVISKVPASLASVTAHLMVFAPVHKSSGQFEEPSSDWSGVT
jgi:hypothetical protein